MDGDDAPHAGDDSGKHLRIFADIAYGRGLKGWASFLKLIPPRHVSPYLKVIAHHFSR